MPKEGDLVWYSVGQTINTGQYESVRLDVGAQRTVPEGADADEVFEELREEVDERLNTTVEEVVEELDKSKKPKKGGRR